MIVYQPKGKAREYADWACNIWRGCSHGCTYCYCPQVLHMNRETFHKDVSLRPAFFERLEKECGCGKNRGKNVLLCFTSDPYQPLEAVHKYTRKTIQILHNGDASVTVLTKAPSLALRDLDILEPGRDVIATTLTLLDRAVSLSWEPNAEEPQQRIKAMELFKSEGFETWVSLEPVIFPRQTLDIIEETAGLFDLYRIGRLNYVQNNTDWKQFTEDVVKLCNLYGLRHIIKNDLKEYVQK